MNPCSRQKHSLTLLAAGSLDDPAARQLRSHVQTCVACAEYLAEMEALCGAIEKAAARTAPLEPSPFFHAKLEQAVTNSTASPTGAVSLLTLWHRWVQLPGLSFALLVAISVAMIVTRPSANQPQSRVREGSTPSVTRTATPNAPTDIARTTTLLAYQRAFVESPQQLENLMAYNEKHAPRAFGTTAFSRRSNSRL